ncbi:hypothetical protein ACFL3S_09495 [Gemmatimonadota bacterium]
MAVVSVGRKPTPEQLRRFSDRFVGHHERELRLLYAADDPDVIRVWDLVLTLFAFHYTFPIEDPNDSRQQDWRENREWDLGPWPMALAKAIARVRWSNPKNPAVRQSIAVWARDYVGKSVEEIKIELITRAFLDLGGLRAPVDDSVGAFSLWAIRKALSIAEKTAEQLVDAPRKTIGLRSREAALEAAELMPQPDRHRVPGTGARYRPGELVSPRPTALDALVAAEDQRTARQAFHHILAVLPPKTREVIHAHRDLIEEGCPDDELTAGVSEILCMASSTVRRHWQIARARARD